MSAANCVPLLSRESELLESAVVGPPPPICHHTPPAPPRPAPFPLFLTHNCSKRNGHVEAVKREVEVLRRLRGCLNVASLEAVYEDDSHVHLVLEYCKGGELAHRIGETHYSGGCCCCCWVCSTLPCRVMMLADG